MSKHSYGGGLFAPLSGRDFRELRAQFRQIIPKANPRCPHEGTDSGDFECHGYGEAYSKARHRMRTRDDIAREKGLDH